MTTCGICGRRLMAARTRHYRRHVAFGVAVELVREWDSTVSRVFLPTAAAGAIETLLDHGFMRAEPSTR